jgi:dihydroorotate dehydrogenase (NAD+) catalytic subunit
VSLAVEIAGIELRNPFLAASGTIGYGIEVADTLDLSRLGGLVLKGLYLEPRGGNPPPRLAETPAGLLNAIGLQGIGARRFVREIGPRLAQLDTVVLANVCGDTVEEYAEVTRVLSEAPAIRGFELNVSCPNVKTGGMAFGVDPSLLHDVVAAVRRVTPLPVIPKLSPNVTDIATCARAAWEAGANALSCINTLLGLAIDVETRRPRLAFGTGGLSGPAIRPVAVRMTWQVARAVPIPVIGVGGICSASDALEFLIAGARAVQIGTANFVDLDIYTRLVADLSSYLDHHGLDNVDAVVGTLEYPGQPGGATSQVEG